jgi:hypothetical protein
MRKTLLNLAAAAALVAVSAGAQAGTLANAATGTAVIYTFGAPGPITWVEGQADLVAGLGSTAVYGTLTGVSADAVLVDSHTEPFTVAAQANDLTILVTDGGSGFLLQVGGAYDYGSVQLHSWGNGASAVLGTPVSGTVAVAATQPVFFGNGSDPLSIFVGNGQYGGAILLDSGTWTGSVTLYGLQLAAVPEPASWAMFAAGAAGLAGWMARRRKAAVTA